MQIHRAIPLALSLVACGGGTNSLPKTSSIDPKDNPHGYPACGSDPKTQPSPCIDEKLAVRCKTDSGYPGDELGLCPIDDSEGVLIHMGPSDYSDPEALAPWLLPAGGEEEFCQHTKSTNTEARYFSTYHGRMRPHSHHWIVTVPNAPADAEPAPYVCPPTTAVIDRWLFGAQTPQIDTRIASGNGIGNPGDPDYGLAHDFPPEQTILMDLHYVNTTTDALLREAWAVLKWVDPADVKQTSDLLNWINTRISLPPLGHYTTQRAICNVPADASGAQNPVYLGLTTAHAHQRMIRTTVYHGMPDGSEEVIYESHNWHEPGEAVFDGTKENPTLPLADGQDWGALSGFMKVMPGETISYECEYQNDQNHTVTFGDTTKDEMCNIFGFYYPTAGHMWPCAPTGR